jgi:hypothetical protein
MDESHPVFQDVYVTFHASIVRYLTRLVSGARRKIWLKRPREGEPGPGRLSR